MKNEKIKEFLTKLAQEEGFKNEFLKLKEKVEKKGFSKKDNEKFISECLLPWSKKLGYKLSKKDFIDFDRTQKPTEITGLTTEQLENVSGGGFPMLFALFSIFGGALAGLAGGGGSTGNNANTNSGSFSSSLVEYSPTGMASQDYYDYHYGTTPADFGSGTATGAGATSASSDTPSDWTTDQDYLSSAQRFEGTENTSEADFNNPFAGREPIYTQPGLDSPASGAGTTASESSQQAQPTPAGDTYSPINPSTWQDVPEQTGAAAGRPMSTALVTTPGQPQTSVEDYNENFARSSAAVDSGENVVQMLKDIHAAENTSPASSQQAQPTPAGDTYSPINPSTWQDVSEQTGTAEGAGTTISKSSQQAQPTPAGDTYSPINPSTWQDVPEQAGTTAGADTTAPTAQKGPTGIASYDNYLVGEGELPSGTGTTPVAFGSGAAAGADTTTSGLFTQTNTTQGNSTFNANQNHTTSNDTQGTSSFSSAQNGQSWKEFAKGTAQLAGIGTVLTGATLGTAVAVGAAGSVLDEALTNITKKTANKTKDKKSTKETKEEGSDFMRNFMENLKKTGPEASKYLDSLK